jgi:hypothetical protein
MGLSGLIIQTIKMQLFRLYENKQRMMYLWFYTQVIRENYRIGIPRKKVKEIFNSDAKIYMEVQLKFC